MGVSQLSGNAVANSGVSRAHFQPSCTGFFVSSPNQCRAVPFLLISAAFVPPLCRPAPGVVSGGIGAESNVTCAANLV
jgi:hypothetical protein